MRKMIAVAFASATLLLLVPSMAAGAFYGTPTGKAKKECQAAGGTWITYQADLPAALDTDRSEIQRRSRGCKEEFGHALVPLSLPRLRRLVPLSIGLSAQLLR